jgi:hypothetical protein
MTCRGHRTNADTCDTRATIAAWAQFLSWCTESRVASADIEVSYRKKKEPIVIPAIEET